MTTSKQLMINDIKKYIKDNERDGGVQTQMNVNLGWEVLEEIEALNLIQAEKLKRTIDEANVRGKAADKKYGWGFHKISPLDYIAFLDK